MPLLTRPDARRSVPGSLLATVAAKARPEHLAWGRTGAGLGMIVRPRLLPGLLGVDSATSARMDWSTQMLGAREVALGLGTLAALHSPDRRAARLWMAGGVLCDAADALVVGGALVRGRVSKAAGGATVALALTAVAVGLRMLGEDDSDRRNC